MSLTVKVIRDLGDIPGPDITCEYFAEEAIFQQRGRVEIDKSSRGLKLTSITLPGMRTHVRPGRIIHITDLEAEYRAKVKSIQFSVGIASDGVPSAVCSLGLRMLEVA